MNNNTLDPNVGMTESIIHEHQLPKLIGPEKWRDLARMLDFSQNEIDIISEKKQLPQGMLYRCPRKMDPSRGTGCYCWKACRCPD